MIGPLTWPGSDIVEYHLSWAILPASVFVTLYAELASNQMVEAWRDRLVETLKPYMFPVRDGVPGAFPPAN